MLGGFLLLACSCLVFSSTAGVPLRSSGPGLMVLKDGKPVPVALPFVPPPPPGSSQGVQEQLDAKVLARQFIDDLLTREIKLQMDKTNLEKFVTEMLMWRKRTFASAL